jgi:hypothetical protein
MPQLTLTALKKLKNIEVFVKLFKEWLKEKCQITKRINATHCEW